MGDWALGIGKRGKGRQGDGERGRGGDKGMGSNLIIPMPNALFPIPYF
jgi:hypothetical protein